MCGIIFHKDPSTGLHTLMALVSPLKTQRRYQMPWIGFMNGMSHYYLWGGVVQITTEPIWVILYGAYHLFCAIKYMQGLHNITF